MTKIRIEVRPHLTLLFGMRLLCELIIVAALIYVGWDKPFHEWLPGSQPPPAATVAAPIAKAPVTAQPAWMHDPNHRTSLDTPHPAAAAPAPAGTAGSWMFDKNHHSPLDPTAHASATPH